MTFKVGDMVRPRSQWRDDPNEVPSGRVRKIAPWGHDGALYVGDEQRAFAADVFEFDSEAG